VSAAGVVGDRVAGRWLNLNEPSVVRSFIDLLSASGWPSSDRSFLHVNGWNWFDEAYLHSAQAACGAADSASKIVKHG
jgi:hypothetical protein